MGADVTATYFKGKRFIHRDRLTYLQANLTDFNQCLKATEGIDYVFMLAANTSGAAVIEKDPLAHLTPNVVMNSYMLAASYQNNIKNSALLVRILSIL